MEHGTGDGGCKGKCSAVHPTMCDASINTGRFINVGKGVKCKNGYHVKGTKKDTSIEVQGNSPQNNTRTVQPQPLTQNHGNNEVQSNMSSDFSGSGKQEEFQNFKEEMRNTFQGQVKYMREQQPPQPKLQPQSQPTQTVDLATVIKLMADRR